jgi:hypothetical protein
MKINRKKFNRILKNIKMDLLRIAVYAIMIFVAIFAICFVVSIPEIIGMLIFG